MYTFTKRMKNSNKKLFRYTASKQTENERKRDRENLEEENCNKLFLRKIYLSVEHLPSMCESWI